MKYRGPDALFNRVAALDLPTVQRLYRLREEGNIQAVSRILEAFHVDNSDVSRFWNLIAARLRFLRRQNFTPGRGAALAHVRPTEDNNYGGH
jgi:hypothetical protein